MALKIPFVLSAILGSASSEDCCGASDKVLKVVIETNPTLQFPKKPKINHLKFLTNFPTPGCDVLCLAFII